MTRRQTQVSVAKRKEQHPEQYCPAKSCLWHTGGGYCPRHKHLGETTARTDIDTELRRLGWSLEDALLMAVGDGVIHTTKPTMVPRLEQLTPEQKNEFLEHLIGAEPAEPE